MATLRQIWVSGKHAANSAMKNTGHEEGIKDINSLFKEFDSDLGPQLDKFEKLPASAKKDKAQKILATIAKYRGAIRRLVPGERNLTLSLSAIEEEVVKQAKT